MTAFLFYIGRSGLYLGIFYAFYLLVMRRTTFFRLNRGVLLIGSLACALLPFLRIRTSTLAMGAGALTITGAEDSSIDAVGATAFSWPDLLQVLYVAGALAVIVFTAISTIRMLRLIRTGEERRMDGYRTIVLKDNHPSFSVAKTIVIGEKDLKENPAIFTHEKMHVRCRHYLDLFVFRVIQIVWWWNPLVWIMRTELGLLHEYEADEAVLNTGIEASQYQLLLVRKTVGDERFTLASGFRHANLKCRIGMMLKSSTPAWMRLSYLAVIPLLAAFAYACNAPMIQAETTGERSEEPIYQVIVTDTPEVLSDGVPFSMVEVKPTFRGGDANEFSRWVNQNLRYPETAIAAGIEGRIILTFSIDPDGSMTDIRILRGVHPDLDAEALRVMNSCTERWTPGMQQETPVKVTFTFPIIFQLS